MTVLLVAIALFMILLLGLGLMTAPDIARYLKIKRM